MRRGTNRMFVLSYIYFGLLNSNIVFWFLLLLGIIVKVPVFLVHG